MKFATVETLKSKAGELKRDIFALYLAMRDSRTPWYAKALAAAVVAYALSPIDLIPDFIPILGHLDDLVLLPLGIVFVLKMIPAEVMADCRAKATTLKPQPRRNWRAAAVLVFVWVLAVILLGRFLLRYYLRGQNWEARFGY